MEIEEIRAIASISSSVMLFKLFDVLRVFEETAYYILLIKETLYEIRHFMILILLPLNMFGIPMGILNFNRDTDNEVVAKFTGIWFFDLLINQYFIALGDFFSLETYAKGTQTVLCLSIFIMTTFIT